MKQKLKIVYIAGLLMVLLTGSNAQSGGGFEITDFVFGPAGEPAADGIFELDTTIGQSVVGTSSSGNFSVTSGFWNFTPFAPTAAAISISGRVLDDAGAPLANAVVYLQTQEGGIISARSSSFGIYRFNDIAAGQTVLISVRTRRFNYAPRTIIVADEISELDFIPER